MDRPGHHAHALPIPLPGAGEIVLGLFGLVILAVLLVRFPRTLLSLSLAFLLCFHHHGVPAFGIDHTPPPICCTLAQSLEAPGPARPTVILGSLRLPLPPLPFVSPGALRKRPAIRSPPWIPNELAPAC